MNQNKDNAKIWTAIVEFKINAPLYVRFKGPTKGYIETTRKCAPTKTLQGNKMNALTLSDSQ